MADGEASHRTSAMRSNSFLYIAMVWMIVLSIRDYYGASSKSVANAATSPQSRERIHDVRVDGEDDEFRDFEPISSESYGVDQANGASFQNMGASFGDESVAPRVRVTGKVPQVLVQFCTS